MSRFPIQTARLLLRRFTAADLEGFQSYRTDPDLAKYQGWDPISDDEARLFLDASSRQTLGATGEWLQVAITRLDTGELIGDLGLCVVDEPRRIVELGFTVATPAQRQGFARESVEGLLKALLGSAHANTVVAVSDSRNAASIGLLKRIGFSFQHAEPVVFRGERCEDQTFKMTAARWKNLTT